MISKQKIKILVKEECGKKIGEEAFKKMSVILEGYAKKIIERASKNADFSGRSIIKSEDFGCFDY